MIGGLLLIVVLFFLSQALLRKIKKERNWFSIKLIQNLYWYHTFFAAVYYIMALYASSDSVEYFSRTQFYYKNWFEAFESGTPFIDFVAYPFINYLHFSYEMMMILFAWMGFWGFVYFYIFFKENIRYTHKFQGYDLITLFIFLPNMHFWTASLGKGSIIFLGLGLATYALSQLKHRKPALVLGLAIVYYVRPHVFLFMIVGIIVGFVTGKQKVPAYQKILVIAGGIVALALLYNSIIDFVGLDSDNLVSSFDQFSSHRAEELAKANSGIDISNYPLIFKLFTFWFRPLFIDAPGVNGLIVSFENLLYIFLTYKLFQSGFFKFFGKSSALVKTSAVVFLGISIALAQTLSNMGIIVREKSMVMYYLLFIIISFLDYKKSLYISKKEKALAQKQAQPVQAINMA
ncbi:MAG: hypothetical protein ABJA79_06870 [Parafilimonas sp.]